MDFIIVKANIVNVVTDAIVLPANPMLKSGSGVSEVIFKAAGKKKLEEECQSIIKKAGILKIGDAIPTNSYNLSSRYIIHAVVPKWIDGNSNEYEALSSAYLAALNIADLMNCESITFPLLSSGNNGFDTDLAFEIAKESINSYVGKNIKQIILVIYDTHTAAKLKEKGYQYIEFMGSGKNNTIDIKPKPLVRQDDINKVVDFLNDSNNQKMIIEVSKNVVKIAVGISTIIKKK